jgi:hypothetical protein
MFNRNDSSQNSKSMKRQILKLAITVALTIFWGWVSIVYAADSSANLDENGVQIVKSKILVKPLDFSQTPTTVGLMVAGQLGGILYPTHELQDKKRGEAARLDFGNAIEEWNKHNYTGAVVLFKKHVQKFPGSSWAGEATLHIGCDSTYKGIYSVGETVCTQVMAWSSNYLDGHPIDDKWHALIPHNFTV